MTFDLLNVSGLPIRIEQEVELFRCFMFILVKLTPTLRAPLCPFLRKSSTSPLFFEKKLAFDFDEALHGFV